MLINWLDLLISLLSLVVFIVYAYFTYLIAKDTFTPFVSFNLKKIKKSLIEFRMLNRSKVESEVLGVVWTKIDGILFKHNRGFYGNKSNWILQPFTQVNGNFNLEDLTNERGIKIKDFLEMKSINSIIFNMKIKYRRIGKRKWIETSPQKYLYNFKNGDFWPHV